MSDPRPPGLHPLAWEVLRDLAEEANPLADQVDVIEACTESIGIWSRAGCPLLDDGDLPVDVDPEPPPADPRLLAMANRALGEQLAQEQEVCRVLSATAADAIRERDEARAEVERLLRTGACECPAEDVCRLTRERDEARAAMEGARSACRAMRAEHGRLVRERDEARAEVERLRGPADAAPWHATHKMEPGAPGCVHCKGPVCTLGECTGNHEGQELTDGRWTCSTECSKAAKAAGGER